MDPLSQTLTDDVDCLRVVGFAPVNSRMTSLSAMIIHTVNLILCLIFGEVRIMNSDNVGDFGENSVGHRFAFG